MGAYIWQLLLLAQNPLTLSGCSTVKKNSDQNLLQYTNIEPFELGKFYHPMFEVQLLTL